ncbi:MAG: hypothetical protein RIS92_814 [Verrucomicrobiota bacterium]|jgi:hypothetical protein
MGVRLPLMAFLGVALCGCSGRRGEELRGITWTFEALAPAIAVGLESDRSFASAERLFGARCGRCHEFGNGRGGLSRARLHLSVDEWLLWVTGGAESKRCAGCGVGRALDGLEQGAVLDLMAILVHGANPEDAAFRGGER